MSGLGARATDPIFLGVMVTSSNKKAWDDLVTKLDGVGIHARTAVWTGEPYNPNTSRGGVASRAFLSTRVAMIQLNRSIPFYVEIQPKCWRMSRKSCREA